MLTPILCSSAIFMSMFFALRGMANCPVESLSTGGLAWFTDLTVADPYYLLPTLTSSTMFLQIYLGADGMDTSNIPKPIQRFMFVIPFLGLPVMATFPAALGVYWMTNNVISICQATMLRSKAVRERLGFPQTKTWKPEDLPMSNLDQFLTKQSKKHEAMKIDKPKAKLSTSSEVSKLSPEALAEIENRIRKRIAEENQRKSKKN